MYLTNTPRGYIILPKRGIKFMSNTKENNCCCHCNCERTTERTDKEYKSLMNRLARIEGQVKGIRGMVEKDAYCTDIIMQVSAVTAALNAFNKEILSNHIKGCVTRIFLRAKRKL